MEKLKNNIKTNSNNNLTINLNKLLQNNNLQKNKSKLNRTLHANEFLLVTKDVTMIEFNSYENFHLPNTLLKMSVISIIFFQYNKNYLLSFELNKNLILMFHKIMLTAINQRKKTIPKQVQGLMLLRPWNFRYLRILILGIIFEIKTKKCSSVLAKLFWNKFKARKFPGLLKKLKKRRFRKNDRNRRRKYAISKVKRMFCRSLFFNVKYIQGRTMEGHLQNVRSKLRILKTQKHFRPFSHTVKKHVKVLQNSQIFLEKKKKTETKRFTNKNKKFFVNFRKFCRKSVESGRKKLKFFYSHYSLKQRLNIKKKPTHIIYNKQRKDSIESQQINASKSVIKSRPITVKKIDMKKQQKSNN